MLRHPGPTIRGMLLPLKVAMLFFTVSLLLHLLGIVSNTSICDPQVLRYVTCEVHVVP